MLTDKIQSAVVTITRHNDLILAVLVVAIISLIILPFPTALMDTFIATNIGISISLLMLSMYITNSISLSTFPTLLLLTTLFRLALNIASTRLILLNTDAGKIIETFGNFVVAGNFVVGAVVFLIITIVNFLVIAKGSERVAEVAARFTLDAMPGKQMSIDADLRAGSIDMAEAQKRRSVIELESSLFGAMDGAMKFVKGDAIAGLIVTVINIIGGFSIGVLQKGMPMAKAIQTYSVLTIGDGLVSQIPALLISITAGILITRTSDNKMPHLGGEIGFQVLSQPKSILISGLIICAFSLIPGFPKIQFVLIGLSIVMVGFIFYQSHLKSNTSADRQAEQLLKQISGKPTLAEEKARQDGDLSFTIPLQIDLDMLAKKQIDPRSFNSELMSIRRVLYMDLGIIFPDVHLNLNHSVPNGRYNILINEIPIAHGRLNPGHFFTFESETTLAVMDIESVPDNPLISDQPTLWVPYRYKQKLDRAQIKYMGPSRLLAYHISTILRKYAPEFIGLQETIHLIKMMEEKFPDLVQELQKILSVPQITEVLQRLVEEGISIRNLRDIFHYLIEWGPKEKDPILLTEHVRSGIKRYISYRYSGGQNLLAVYMLDRDLEEEIRKAIRKSSGTSYLVLGAEKNKRILNAIKAEVGELNGDRPHPALLTPMDIRRYVKKLVEPELKHLPVLSYQELAPEISIQPLGRIHI
jgi:type III secretion protein V